MKVAQASRVGGFRPIADTAPANRRIGELNKNWINFRAVTGARPVPTFLKSLRVQKSHPVGQMTHAVKEPFEMQDECA